MKKVFLFAVATVLFACQASFASKNGEFTFGIDKIFTHTLRNSINYSDGKKDKIEKRRLGKMTMEGNMTMKEKLKLLRKLIMF
jgi:hypothetical protein